MAYGKLQDTYQYWEKWNCKNKNVENYFLAQWEDQFNRIRKICKEIEKPENLVKENLFGEDPYYSTYIGEIFSITPSGKFYVPFASSNVSVKEAAIDEFWREKFEEVLEEENCWDESGEGSGSDMFICKGYEKPEIDHEKMVEILREKILIDLNSGDYLAIPGIFEILSEYYNNDILEEYEKESL